MLTICFVNLLLQYLEFSGNLGPGLPFEAFWVMGQATVLLGVFSAGSRGIRNRSAFSFRFDNTRARFILSLVGLVAALHFSWHLFFISLGAEQNQIIEAFLFVIFLSLTLAPLTLIFKSYLIKPILKVLETIHQSKDESLAAPTMDEDLQRSGMQVVRRIVQAERERAKHQALAELAAQVVHDIQSPISALVQLSSKEGRSKIDDKALALSAAERLQHISNELLIRYQGKPATQNTVTSQLGDVAKRILEEKEAEHTSPVLPSFSLSIAPEVKHRRLRIGEIELGRILSNLINNSIDALEEEPNPRVRLTATASRDSRFAILNIIDNGKGIPQSILEKLRTSGGSFNKKRGSGLGLSSARKIVSRLGGALMIHSEPGQGTRVTLRIPFANENGLLAPPTTPIVLIDNDSIVRRLWKRQAEELGIKIFIGEREADIPFGDLATDTAIFVDKNLSKGEDGLSICKRLYQRGFSNLYITTGEMDLVAPSFVTVIGKEFPYLKEKRGIPTRHA